VNEDLFEARMAMLKKLDLPVSSGGVQLLRLKQRIKLFLWEANLGSLFFIKRVIDILGSLVGILLASPLFLAVAAAIVIEDGWPVLYVQNRVGLNGRNFRFYKFRSMRRDADEIKKRLMQENESKDGVIFKMKNDPRVTKTGRFIRRFSIDEMPQLFNVLIGDLALVGPRPPLPDEVSQYTLEERKRLHVKPGLTCLWQIKGRSDIPFKQQVQLDLAYIGSQSIWDDIVIMIKTIPAVLLGRGAY
jgi:lipopolysaccharide/colanic/teichoic acid biosynthesis glycosyltransferase